jgi:hypothetical protein
VAAVTAPPPPGLPPRGADASSGPSLAGLTEREAGARRARGLGNDAPLTTGRTCRQILRENAFTFLNAVLLALALALVALGRASDAVVSVAVVLTNVVVSVAQEVRAKRTLDRFALLTRPTTVAIRGGRERAIDPAGSTEPRVPRAPSCQSTPIGAASRRRRRLRACSSSGTRLASGETRIPDASGRCP